MFPEKESLVVEAYLGFASTSFKLQSPECQITFKSTRLFLDQA